MAKSPKQSLKAIKEATLTEGKVGIFWLDDANEVVPSNALGTSSEVGQARQVGEFVDSPYDHIRVWERLKIQSQTHRAKYRQAGYDDIPRGRVIYHAPSMKYRVLMPKSLVDDTTARRNIMQAFRLNSANTVFLPDEHYDSMDSADVVD